MKRKWWKEGRTVFHIKCRYSTRGNRPKPRKCRYSTRGNRPKPRKQTIQVCANMYMWWTENGNFP